MKVELKAVNFEWKELFNNDEGLLVRIICNIETKDGVKSNASVLRYISKSHNNRPTYRDDHYEDDTLRLAMNQINLKFNTD